jgi:aryl-alcohol dehydrogenase-like predicted oxidoreductase
VVDAVCTAAEGLGVAPLEVALAWVIGRPGVSSFILGARTVGQLQAALNTDETLLVEEIQLALSDVSA